MAQPESVLSQINNPLAVNMPFSTMQSPSRSLVVRTALAAIAAAVIVSACTAEPTPTPIPPTPTTEPLTAEFVVAESRTAMANAKSAWFQLDHEEGYLPLSGAQVSEMEGAVNQNGAQIDASASLGRLYIELQIIIVDGRIWVTNPLTGAWEETGDPDQPFVWSLTEGVTSIFDAVKDPRFIEPPDDGSDLRIGADVPSEGFNALFFNAATSGEDVYLDATIDRDTYLVKELVIEGQLTDDDTWDAKRTLRLSRFDESFDIKPPA